MNIYSDFNVRDAELSRLLDVDMEVFKMNLEIDFSEGVLKNLIFVFYRQNCHYVCNIIDCYSVN